MWNFEYKQITSLLALDLSTAFGTVDHSVLVSMLRTSFGLQDPALAWFKSYLKDRFMQVQINNTLSLHKPINFSVPQGSVCGPMLFSCYISSLPSVVSDPVTHISSYADDIEIHRSSNPKLIQGEVTNVNLLIPTLKNTQTWMDMNVLKLNMNKTEFIYFASRQHLEKCSLTDIRVENVTVMISRNSSIKSLDAWLDEQLTFNDRIFSKM